MALEKLNAYLAGRTNVDFGECIEIGPDRFEFLKSSDLLREHEMLTILLKAETERTTEASDRAIETRKEIIAGDTDSRTRYFTALVERIFAYETTPSAGTEFDLCGNFLDSEYAAKLLIRLTEHGIDFEPLALPTLNWLTAHAILSKFSELTHTLVKELSTKFSSQNLPASLKQSLINLRGRILDSDSITLRKETLTLVDNLTGDGPWKLICPGDAWADKMLNDLAEMQAAERQHWLNLILHCYTGDSSKPTAKWQKAAKEILKELSEDSFVSRMSDWSKFVDKPRNGPSITTKQYPIEERLLMHSSNSQLLRGLLWICSLIPKPEICRSITNIALAAYRKISGFGPRSIKAGNAAVYALGEIATKEAVGQLAILKLRVKLATAQKGIEKALTQTANRVGIAREELEEMSVPSYGLTDIGLLRYDIGDYVTEIKIDGTHVTTTWFNNEGKVLKSAPASLKTDYAETLKEVKQAASDIEKMLPAQVSRIEQTYLLKKEWPFPIWHERYMEHPLVGTIAKRLIWQFRDDDKQISAIFHDEQFVDLNNKPVDWISENTKVKLWHPIFAKEDTSEVLSWRNWLIEHKLTQPFKQAHREIYILTDAERNTNIYSNRFAAHILKQHQFNALCLARCWKNQLRLLVDAEFPPAHMEIPSFGLRAEFWIEGIGTNYGTDTNETGTFLYISTDQVRFYRSQAAKHSAHASGGGYLSQGLDREENHPLPLEEIPALVFSEIMRDVDMFVGVASVGNDPAWADGGEQGRYRDYWQNYSFGELGTSAQLRKTVLQNLLPKLKIAERCSFIDRFLVVRGDLRTYKIHLGSGNILMEPNDQYLCIVAKQSVSDRSNNIFLPFAGDNMLSVILSKAFLLAEDAKITDSSITNQIGSKVPTH